MTVDNNETLNNPKKKQNNKPKAESSAKSGVIGYSGDMFAEC